MVCGGCPAAARCVRSLVQALPRYFVLMMLVIFILAATGSNVDEHAAAAGAAV